MNNSNDEIDLDKIEENVMSELKDFQKATVNRIDDLFTNHQNRILVSDEVGLGKTLIARGVIAKFAKLRRKEGDDLVKVVYICSNGTIAQQNLEKLKIFQDANVSDANTSRLSMQHLNIFLDENDDDIRRGYIQIIPLTPQTSFKITNSQGLAEERALIYTILKRHEKFEGYDKELSEFLRFGVGNWDYLTGFYKDKVEECDEKSKENENSEEGYLHYMDNKLEEFFKKYEVNGKLLICELISFLRKNDFKSEESKKLSRQFIIVLRRIFTEISLDKLDPDIIIMDEFQRFKYLLNSDKDSDMGMLIDKFFNNENNPNLRILLLSATPYKMYSTLEEISDKHVDEHYKEFFDVINFLNNDEDDRIHFNKVWSNYSSKLKDIAKDKDSFIIAKNEAEDELYKHICRTERIAETHNADIIDDSDKDNLLKIFKEDIISYRDFEKLLRSIKIPINHVPIDYIKSSPYLMSFMRDYNLKKHIFEYFKENPQEISKIKENSFWIKGADIEKYKKISFNNARLNYLMENVLKDHAELLLWVPPSKEYYPSEGVFKDVHNFSKTLIFSSWEMVPRMISTLVSYEVERKTIGKFSKSNPSIKYFKKNNYISPRIKYSKDSKGKPDHMTLLSLIYPSSYLSMVYVPIECLNNHLSLGDIEILLKTRIKPKLDYFKEDFTSYDNYGMNLEDNRWYYLAPLLLDCLDEKFKKEYEQGDSTLGWYDCTDYVDNWFKEFKESLKKEKDKDKKERKNFEAHIQSLEDTFNALVYYAKNEDNEFIPQYHKGSDRPILKLGGKPDDLLDVLTDLAIASPANCIYRSYRRELSSYADLDLRISRKNSADYYSNELLKEALAEEMKKYVSLCSKFSFNFLYLMNAQEVMATFDYIFGKLSRFNIYWKNILTYSKQGNLQAVFDEYVHLLSNGLDKNNDNRIKIIHERFLGSMNIKTTPYDVDNFYKFKARVNGREDKEMRLRTHFAVPFTKGADNEIDTNRKTSVRDAFNSPFRPFVLASTSIGQEGLDFHNYCRRIVHWNLPSNPIDLEQREGRINRFACLAIRQNIAERYGDRDDFKNNIWIEMFEEASSNESPKGVSDLIPFWGLRDPKDIECMKDENDEKDKNMIKIERILPLYPFSIDEERYKRLIKILSVYRLTLGQARQVELVESFLNDGKEHDLDEFINLSPFYKDKKV